MFPMQGGHWGVNKYRVSTTEKLPNIDQIATTKVLKNTRNADLQHFATKVRMLNIAGLFYSISQEMHVKQNAGGNFYISSFNDRVMHFQVLRYIIFGGNLSPFLDFDKISTI